MSKPPRVYHKPMIIPRLTGREAPNERIVEIKGFMIDEGCFVSVIEGSTGLAIRIFNLSSDHVSVAVENRIGERRSA